MGAKPTDNALSKLSTALLCAESDVAQPSRARSASFAAAVADLRIGGEPAAKAMRIDPAMTIEEVTASKSLLNEKLRNAVQSAVSQAKRRIGAADYSIEISDLTTKSGVYLIAIVNRNS